MNARTRRRGARRARNAMLLAVAFASACAASERRFALRDPLLVDPDQRAFSPPCHVSDTGERVCTPEPYVSPLVWDAADNTVFRPVAKFFAVDPAGEAVNVNSFDETPDSSWFQNRIGVRPVPRDELLRGACSDPADLNPDDPDGSWLIDMGKQNGATPGFRVRTPKGGKFLIKVDTAAAVERASAASVIGSRIYNAVGYYTPCERVVYLRPSLFRLKPGLQSIDNSGIPRAFDETALKTILSRGEWRGDRVRIAASQWLPHAVLGPFQYEGTRSDDPNDIIAHEDRRELRGGRLLAAWLNHFDSREQNTMNVWVSLGASKTDGPGFIRHYYLDFSDSFGSEWDWDGISRRLGHSYYLDFGDVLLDYATLGLVERPWDRAQRTKGAEGFGYYRSTDFEPEAWKAGYPNPAFGRMTERDGAWMARILARFTDDDIAALVDFAQLQEPRHAQFLTRTLIERKQRILARYFARVSPLTDVRLEGSTLCAVDLARRARVYSEGVYHDSAARRVQDDGSAERLPVEQRGDAICADLGPAHAAPGLRSDDPARYVVVTLHNGVSRGPLEVHLYDLGGEHGYRLVGLVRKE